MANHQFMTTEDGSLTLSTTYQNGVCERMHHFRGALSESIYIYEPAIQAIFQLQIPQTYVMSLGLGLGYNELICAAQALKNQLDEQIHLTTFEIDQELTTHFLNWLQSGQDAWSEAFDQIDSSLCTHYQFAVGTLRQTLFKWHQTGQWQLRAGFPEQLPTLDRYHVVMYDAFSRKMDELLWHENFLSEFLRDHTLAPAAFATYASTGNLKRALKANGFQIQTKPGFGGKKESTLALLTAKTK